MTLFIGKTARPNPLDAEGCFAPAYGSVVAAVHQRESHTGAGHRSHGFWTELERHPRRYGNKVKANAGDFEACRHDSQLLGRMTIQSGSGRPLVSGANQINTSPSKYTRVIVAPARA